MCLYYFRLAGLPRFISHTLTILVKERGTKLLFIQPSNSQQNCLCCEIKEHSLFWLATELQS
jgi:hypothetical protein